MVALKPMQVAAQVAKPDAAYQVFLIYGPDAGLVSERGRQLASALADQAGGDADIMRLDEVDIDGDPDRLAIELKTISMFGGSKIVRLRHGPRIRPEFIGDFIDDQPIEGRLIVEADALKKDAKLRKIVEKAKSAVAMPCYADNTQSLEGLIREVLQSAGLSIERDAQDLLVSLLGADRALSRGELEKLALYARGQTGVCREDVRAIVGDASELAVDRVVSAAFAGAPGAAMREADRAVSAGQTWQGLLLALQRHVLRLAKVRSALDAGLPSDAALRKLRPPLFGRDRDTFMRVCEGWSSAQLVNLQRAIADAVKGSRQHGGVADLLAQKLLLDIARSAGRQARRSAR